MCPQSDSSASESWRKGRKCKTCIDYFEEIDECCADVRSFCTILPVGGFDEDDPNMIKPLDCWLDKEKF
jgi:hypothetical protein